jgi:hypothetical protein
LVDYSTASILILEFNLGAPILLDGERLSGVKEYLSISYSASHAPSSVPRRAWCQIFGGMVQDRREAIGRSVEEAAQLSGMESSEWAAIEAGHIPADPARLRSMADALEVRFDHMALLVYLCQGAWAA